MLEKSLSREQNGACDQKPLASQPKHWHVALCSPCSSLQTSTAQPRTELAATQSHSNWRGAATQPNCFFPPSLQSLFNDHAGDVLEGETACLDPVLIPPTWALDPSGEGMNRHVGGRRRKTKGHYYGAFSVFLFAQKQSIYSSVLQHKYIRKELYYILLGTKKKKSDEGGTDRLSTSAVRIDLFNYFINSYVTSITYTEIQRNTRGRRWGPTQGPVTHAPPWVSQNQTVKCTLLLSINREATLKKKKKKIQW